MLESCSYTTLCVAQKKNTTLCNRRRRRRQWKDLMKLLRYELSSKKTCTYSGGMQKLIMSFFFLVLVNNSGICPDPLCCKSLSPNWNFRYVSSTFDFPSASFFHDWQFFVFSLQHWFLQRCRTSRACSPCAKLAGQACGLWFCWICFF